MSKQRKTLNIENLTGDVAELSRDIWLAGLGAIATVEEEGSKFFDGLVENGKALQQNGSKRLDDLQKEATKTFDSLIKRGRKVEDKGRRQLTARVDAVKGEVTDKQKEVSGTVERVTGKVEATVAAAVETAMERLEVPTRTEVKDLSEKVDLLAGKVNKLTTLLEARAAASTNPTAVYHVVPQDEGWAVTKEGTDRAINVLGTKAEALERGRDLAKNQEPSRLVIHRKDGTIQEQFTYGA
ncbi:MAG TPA: phasin family protein [Rhodothermales bacterium]|nr:phasin family protein [Rhodothermales bacterium]